MSFQFDARSNKFDVETQDNADIESVKEHYLNGQTMICNLTFKGK